MGNDKKSICHRQNSITFLGIFFIALGRSFPQFHCYNMLRIASLYCHLLKCSPSRTLHCHLHCLIGLKAHAIKDSATTRSHDRLRFVPKHVRMADLGDLR